MRGRITSRLALPGLHRLTRKRLFTDKAEESLRLRVLILMNAVWVAAGLELGLRPPLAAPGGVCTGRGGALDQLALEAPRSPLGFRSFLIMAAMVALSITFRGDFITALTSDRLPLAGYMALLSGVASFGLRTRGGLYAQLTLSGLIIFFVSERAFDQTFGEYSEGATRRFEHASADVEWLKRAAWAAAYDPNPPALGVAREAVERLNRLRQRPAQAYGQHAAGSDEIGPRRRLALSREWQPSGRRLRGCRGLHGHRDDDNHDRVRDPGGSVRRHGDHDPDPGVRPDKQRRSERAGRR